MAQNTSAWKPVDETSAWRPVPEPFGGTPPDAGGQMRQSAINKIPAELSGHSHWNLPPDLGGPIDVPEPPIGPGMQIVHGLERAAEPGFDNKAAGASGMIRGLGRAAAGGALPLLGAGLATAPLATIGGAAVGSAGAYGGGKLARLGAQKLGGGEGAQDLAQDVGEGVGGAVGGGVGAYGLPKMAGGVKSLARVDPTTAMVKALRPTPSNSGFTENLSESLPYIKSAASGPIRSNEDLIAATKNAVSGHQGSLDAWLDRGRRMGLQISGDPIVTATEGALSSAMKMENPGQASAIIYQIRKAYGAKKLSVDQMRQLLKDKNAELDSFYDKSTGKQNSTVTSGAPQAVVKAQRDAIADTLYKALDPENQGAGPRSIQRQTGNMMELSDAATRRKNAIASEKPISKLGVIGKRATALLDLPGKALHGNVEEGLSNLFHGPAGTSDPLIRRAFSAVGESKPLPTPGPFEPRGLLGPAPIATPPPADTSGPIPFMRQPEWSQPQSVRLLGPARGNPVTPSSGKPIATPAPEGSFPKSGPLPTIFPKGSGTNRLLESPKQFPSGGFSTGTTNDLVPIKHPVTGQIEYVPKWTIQPNSAK